MHLRDIHDVGGGGGDVSVIDYMCPRKEDGRSQGCGWKCHSQRRELDLPWFGRKVSSALGISVWSVCGVAGSRDLVGGCIHVFGAQESDWKLLASSGT